MDIKARQEKLQEEAKVVNDNIINLQAFIETDAFLDLDEVQQSLLNIQLYAMSTYSQCLTERLYWLDAE